MNSHPKDPLHGYTLEIIIVRLVEEYGWDELADRIRIRCFASDPSVKSTLKFLRKTPWARNKVEKLFIETLERQEREL
ncbi:MAG: DUF2132 domain-containing protein [Verrucomicrobia bacterium]|jgi:uncharacterized protein (DUF2132 family)|nr:DUF2132 domain-containing protein [Verrucomicrobiota bacterium]|tara:strand:- start:26875 stop:27108 length:234 start_codon:yes stop_codon:yes gene_type:complete